MGAAWQTTGTAWQTTAAASQTEYGRITRIALRHPRQAWGSQQRLDADWQALGYRGCPDMAAGIAEYDRLVALLTGIGAGIDWLPAADGLTADSLYVRDAALVTAQGLILCRMGKAARRAEPPALATALERAGVPVVGALEGTARLEGGDVVWIDDRTLIVGRGYRTNDEGIRQLGASLGPSVQMVAVDLPHHRGPDDVFHLMSVLSPVDADLVVGFPPLMPVRLVDWLRHRGIAIIAVPAEEVDGLGCNVLAVAPRRVVMVRGNPVTAGRLRDAGCDVTEIAAGDIALKGEGGPTCLTRPLSRVV